MSLTTPLLSLTAPQVSQLLTVAGAEAKPGKLASEVASLRASIEAAKQGWAATSGRDLAAAAAEDGARGDASGGDGWGDGSQVGPSGAGGKGGGWVEGWIWDLPQEQQPVEQPGQGGAEGQPPPAYVPPNPLHSPALIEALLREVRRACLLRAHGRSGLPGRSRIKQ